MSAPLNDSGRVESGNAFHLMTGGNAGKSANDSLGGKKRKSTSRAKRAYVTRARVAAVAKCMSDRQWHVLADVARLGVLSGKQIERLQYEASETGSRIARKELSELITTNVLARLDRRVGGVRAGSAGYVYSLGVTGQRLLDPNRSRYRPPWTPRPSYLRHALSVTELYVRLRESERSGGITLTRFDTEPACWRHYAGPGGSRLILKPDAFAVIDVGEFEDRYFIEVDCATEPGTRIRTKAREYVRYWHSGREEAEHGIFPFVAWVAPSPTRAAFLVQPLATLPPDDWGLFVVGTQEEAVKRMAAGTFAPITNEREEVNQ